MARRRVRDYEIIDELGKGGFGTAYRARTEAGVVVVLKKTAESNQEEVNKLQRIEHTNVVGVRDAFEEDGDHWLVLEYVQGQTLATYLETNSPLQLSTWWYILKPLLDGLHRIHTAGIAHRDIKPDNIVLQEVPNGFNPKWIDFGIAHNFHDNQGIHAFAPLYAPPEARDYATMMPHSDLFSLAVMSHQALFGEILQYKEMRDRLEKQNSMVMKALARALDTDQTRRPQSVLDLMFHMVDLDPVQPPMKSGMPFSSEFTDGYDTTHSGFVNETETDTENFLQTEYVTENGGTGTHTATHIEKMTSLHYAQQIDDETVTRKKEEIANSYGLHEWSVEHSKIVTASDLAADIMKTFELRNCKLRFTNKGKKVGGKKHVEKVISSFRHTLDVDKWRVTKLREMIEKHYGLDKWEVPWKVTIEDYKGKDINGNTKVEKLRLPVRSA